MSASSTLHRQPSFSLTHTFPLFLAVSRSLSIYLCCKLCTLVHFFVLLDFLVNEPAPLIYRRDLNVVCNHVSVCAVVEGLTASSPEKGTVFVRCGTGSWSRGLNVVTTGRSGILSVETKRGTWCVLLLSINVHVSVAHRPLWLKLLVSCRADAAVSVKPAPSLFYRTKIVSFFPRILIVNNMSMSLYIRQSNPRGIMVDTPMLALAPGQRAASHFLHHDLPTAIRLLPGVSSCPLIRACMYRMSCCVHGRRVCDVLVRCLLARVDRTVMVLASLRCRGSGARRLVRVRPHRPH